MTNYLFPEARIAIFAKAPIPGQVKTRMQPSLSPENSAELQSKLIKHSIRTALNSRIAPVQLWCAPDTTHQAFSHYADRLELHSQQGNDLGQRMAYAFHHNQQQQFTLLIGTDCPLLTTEHLKQAAQAAKDSDVVLIPAEDGGYVLIGSAEQPACFEEIDWGTSRVLAQSLSALKVNRQSAYLLPELSDLDRPQDLIALPRSIIHALEIHALAAKVQAYLQLSG